MSTIVDNTVGSSSNLTHVMCWLGLLTTLSNLIYLNSNACLENIYMHGSKPRNRLCKYQILLLCITLDDNLMWNAHYTF